MRIILDKDAEQEYIEIKLSLKEIERLKEGKLLLTDVTTRFRKKLLGICVRRDDNANEEG